MLFLLYDAVQDQTRPQPIRMQHFPETVSTSHFWVQSAQNLFLSRTEHQLIRMQPFPETVFPSRFWVQGAQNVCSFQDYTSKVQI